MQRGARRLSDVRRARILQSGLDDASLNLRVVSRTELGEVFAVCAQLARRADREG